MKQQHFEEMHEQAWRTLEDQVNKTESKDDVELNRQFPQLFRQVCQHLALAKSRRYSPQLIERLNLLVIQAHHDFYQFNSRIQSHWLKFFLFSFPDALRRNRAYVRLSWALFLIPGIAIALACFFNEEFIYSFSSADQVISYEAMYNPSDGPIGRERASDSDIMMFGFYIRNNIGVSFRMFAGGILYGIGSVFFLIFNGVSIGGVAGHLTQLGYTDTFFPFVVGHGAFELTAIVFSGAAGLMLGHSLIQPGQLSRLDSLKKAGRDAITIMYGTTVMLLIAAFLEAFWSSSTTIPIAIKYSVGGVFWFLVTFYCVRSGRVHGS